MSVHDVLVDRADRDMFQEGYELAACAVCWTSSTRDEMCAQQSSLAR